MSSRSETLKASSSDGVSISTPPSSSSSRFGGSAAAVVDVDDL